MTDTWLPLSERQNGGKPRRLVDGFPPYLYGPVQVWLYRVLQWAPGPLMVIRPGHESELTTEVMIRLQVTSPAPWLLEAADRRFLDAVDAALALVDWPKREWDGNEATRGDLERILVAGNSAWRVAETFYGLERRVNATVTAGVFETIRSADDVAADHLRAAWESTYGVNPNPDTAYREAVLAVEAAACPLVLPTNSQARLGPVRNHLRDASAKWQLRLPAKDATPAKVDVLVSMLTTLEEGQRSRHAGTPTSRRQTQAEAQAALHLAATLVQWICGGVLVRISP